MRPITSTLINFGAAIALCCVLGPAVRAQDRGVIAICPAVFDKGAGTPEAHAEAIHSMQLKLEHAGFTVVEYDTLSTKWKDVGITMPAEGQMLASADLMRVAKAAGAKFVLEPEFDFNANRNWKVGDKYTTVKAAMNIFKASDGSRAYNQTETISKSTTSGGDYSTLSQAGREQRVVDQAIDVSLARFARRVKLTLH